MPPNAHPIGPAAVGQASSHAPPAPHPAPPGVDALYLHLPFCFHKCHYCDFYSVVDRGEDRQEGFTHALLAELRHANATRTLRPRTIFVGGGTPTYLRSGLWARLLKALHDLGITRDVVEFTVEANPETVTPELMRLLAAGGINRVSIGAQSFDRTSLKALERWHDPDNVGRAVDACRAADITNLSLDLIFAIPGQSLAMLDADLSRLVELQPTHLSTYGLTFEPQTPLAARLRLGQVTPIDEDTQRQMYAHVLNRLAAEGFEHYEVSNWARGDSGFGNADFGNTCVTPKQSLSLGSYSEIRNPQSEMGFRCLHNLAYWHNRNWLGLGPGAASHLAGHRWRNVPSLTRYLATSPEPETTDHERLPADDRVSERLMLGLRLAEGIPRGWLDEHVPPDNRRRESILELVDQGFLDLTDTHLRLTRAGLFVADSVIVKLL